MAGIPPEDQPWDNRIIISSDDEDNDDDPNSWKNTDYFNDVFSEMVEEATAPQNLILTEEPSPNDAVLVNKNEFGTRILEIYGDMAPNHVEHLWNSRIISAAPDLAWFTNTITSIAEAGSYPRKDKKRKRDPEDQNDGLNQEWALKTRDRGDNYQAVGRGILANEFRTVPLNYIKDLISGEGFLYHAYLELEAWERKTTTKEGEKPYHQLHHPRKTHASAASLGTQRLRHAMAKELAAAKAEVAERINEEQAIVQGQTVECGCCFGDTPVNRTVCCQFLHKFCRDCVRQLAATEIGKGLHQLNCMHESGCTTPFEMSTLREVLSEKTILVIERRRQQEEIAAAGIEGLWDCPFCDYKEIVGPIEEDHEFRCRNPECSIVSCRRCNEKSHIPLSCEEYRKEKKSTARHEVEEAMTEALVRTCNKCSFKFYKDEGCNKIICSKCRNMQCYVCGKNVTDYNHFRSDRPGAGNSSKCPLTDDTFDRHKREVEDAGRTAREKLKREYGDLTDAELTVEMSEAVKKAEQEQARRQGGHHPRPGEGFAVPIAEIPPGFPRPPAYGAYMERRRQMDAQMDAQLRLLEAHNRQRLLLARGAQDNAPVGGPEGGMGNFQQIRDGLRDVQRELHYRVPAEPPHPQATGALGEAGLPRNRDHLNDEYQAQLDRMNQARGRLEDARNRLDAQMERARDRPGRDAVDDNTLNDQNPPPLPIIDLRPPNHQRERRNPPQPAHPANNAAVGLPPRQLPQVPAGLRYETPYHNPEQYVMDTWDIQGRAVAPPPPANPANAPFPAQQNPYLQGYGNVGNPGDAPVQVERQAFWGDDWDRAGAAGFEHPDPEAADHARYEEGLINTQIALRREGRYDRADEQLRRTEVAREQARREQAERVAKREARRVAEREVVRAAAPRVEQAAEREAAREAAFLRRAAEPRLQDERVTDYENEHPLKVRPVAGMGRWVMEGDDDEDESDEGDESEEEDESEEDEEGEENEEDEED